MRRHFPTFASAGSFLAGRLQLISSSQTDLLLVLSRLGSRLLQLQQENKKKVSLLKNVLIPLFLPFRRGFFLRNVRRGRRWDEAKSEDPFQSRRANS
ncbi:hypothetical protein [Alkalicoccus saliphilus]|uniref:hypothetical protein n=1 Tax=Alkalicoccus saliphilus TaxID=200989 RepID=UPI00135C1267|nr:hypothetical protein [Alkalicoccus saliphilus]